MQRKGRQQSDVQEALQEALRSEILLNALRSGL
jgi:hypothetical protein